MGHVSKEQGSGVFRKQQELNNNNKAPADWPPIGRYFLSSLLNPHQTSNMGEILMCIFPGTSG